MKYRIVCMIGSCQRNLKENVPEQEVFQIKRVIATIFEFMNEIDNYTMLLGNSKDFLQYTEDGNINLEKMEEFANLNRLFMNWLNSFYVWVEYHERYHKILFGKLKGRFYDQYPEYRITYFLRRYTTHQSCCITKTTLALDTGTVSYLIPVDKILENGDMNKQTKGDLKKVQRENQNIDSQKLVESTTKIIQEFQVELWKEEWKAVKKSLNSLKGYIITDGVALKPTYIVSDDDNVRPYCISNVVGYLIQKMNSYPELKALLH